MIKRTYIGKRDLKLLQDFNAAAIAAVDGTYVTFTIIWFDLLNRIEPVGTHQNY